MSRKARSSRSSSSSSSSAARVAVTMPDLADPSSFSRVNRMDVEAVFVKLAQIDDDDERVQSLGYLIHAHPAYLDELNKSRLDKLSSQFSLPKSSRVGEARSSILAHVNATFVVPDKKLIATKKTMSATNKSKIASLLKKLTSKTVESASSLSSSSTMKNKSKPHALYDRMHASHASDHESENEGDHDLDHERDMEVEDLDDNDDHVIITQQHRPSSTKKPSSSANEVSLVNELISQIAQTSPHLLQQLNIPITKTKTTTSTRPSSSTPSSSSSSSGVRILTHPVPVQQQSSFAAAMQARMPSMQSSSSSSSGVNFEDFIAEDDHSSLPDREARGILIDNSRLSAYILSKTPDGLHKWVRDRDFNNPRNKNECLQWAQVIDGLVSDGAVDINTSEPLERAIRRLIGVHTADQTGKWSTCDALQLGDTRSTLLPPLMFDRTIKRASQLEKLDNRHQNNNNNDRRAPFNNANGFRGRGRGRGGYNNNRPYNNNNNNNNNNHNARPAQGNDRPRYINDNNRGQHAPEQGARN
jgi:hypothetical protein